MIRPLATAAQAPGRLPTLSMAIVLVLLIAAKSPDAFTLPQFWAEDALIFFHQQWGQFWPPVTTTYAGYLHTIPRLIAWLASLLPAVHAPLVYASAALLSTTCSLWYFARKLGTWQLAIIAAGGVLLTPTNVEVFGVMTNIQWFLQFVLVAACFAPLSRPAWRGPMMLAVLLIALTGPFSTMLACIHLGAVLAATLCGRWARLAWLPAYVRSLDRGRLAMLWLGGIIQILALKLGAQPPSVDISVHTMLAALASMTQTHTFGMHLLPPFLFGPLLALLPVVTLLCGRIPHSTRGLLAAAWALALLQIIAGASKPGLLAESVGVGDRYMVLFKPMFWMLLYVALVSCLPLRRGTPAFVIVLTAMLVLAATHRHQLRRPPMPDQHWRQAIAEAQSGRGAIIPVNPHPWQLKLPPRPHQHETHRP